MTLAQRSKNESFALRSVAQIVTIINLQVLKMLTETNKESPDGLISYGKLHLDELHW